MKDSVERQKYLAELDRLNLHLLAVGIAVSICLALAIAAFLYPSMYWDINHIEPAHGILPQLILGLLALVFLSALYVIAKQHGLNQIRRRLLAPVVEATQSNEAYPQDPLTGVPDRRWLSAALELESTRADRYRNTLCLVLFDIRGFREIKGKEAKLAGDLVLKDLAGTLKTIARRTELVLRYGPSQFLCLLPATDQEGGEFFVRRVEKACRRVNRLEKLILDLGIAVYRAGDDPQALVANVERDLATRRSA